MNLFFFPDYTPTNPYQTLVYSGFTSNDAKAQFGSIEDALQFLIAHPTQKAVFHLHWQHTITGIAQSAHEHRIFAKTFIQNIKAFQGLGGIVAWTVHNRLPHDIKFKRAELEYHQALCDLVDLIFLHNASALAQIKEVYGIDASKVAFIEHGNYIDSYPNTISQQQAREYLSIAEDAFVYGFIGQLRPYKGLNEFIDATYDFAGDTNSIALIAGKAVWPYQKGQISQLCAPLKNTKVIEAFISDNELQIYLNAVDVIVLPYKEILTSGSMILAASFAKPVLVPSIASFSDVTDLPFVFSYNPDKKGALAAAIKAIKNLDKNELKALGAQALEYAKALSWKKTGQNMHSQMLQAIQTSSVEYLIEYQLEQDQQHRLLANKHIQHRNDSQTSMAVCVVNYFSHHQVQDLIKSIAQTVKSSISVFVLDNSQDSAEYSALRAIEGIDCVLRSERNLGYAAGNNCLIKFAKDNGYEQICILNPDIVITEDLFANMASNINKNPNAVYSPLILKNESIISFYRASINKQSDCLDITHELDGWKKEFAQTGLKPTDLVNGCAMFFDASIVDKYGYLPESYFLYFEESDWTMSIRQQGGQLFTDASLSLIHQKQTQKNGLPSLTYTYYLLRNSLIFAAKYGYDIAKTKEKYQKSFVTPWAKRIQNSKPDFVFCFEAICQLAFSDGEQGVTGPKDFLQALQALAPNNNASNGFIEVLTNKRIIGWAISDTKADADIAKLLLINNGNIEQSFACSLARQDVADMGHNKIAGFDYKADKNLDVKNVNILDAKSLKVIKQMGAVHQNEQAHAPDIAKAKYNPSLIRGHIDFFENGRITGWAHDELHPDIAVEVELLINGQVCSFAIADKFRDGLKKRKKNGGYCAFIFNLAPSDLHLYEQEDSVDVAIRVRGRQEVVFTKELRLALDDTAYRRDMSLDAFYKWSFYAGPTPYGEFEASDTIQNEITGIKQKLMTMAAEAKTKGQSQTFISIIMPAFNRRKEIKRAIQSVLQQTYSHFELIVVDDGSSDDTVDVVQNIIETDDNNAQIKLIKLPQNMGVSHARNTGLQHAKGDIICYLDTDNEWASEYLELVNYFYNTHLDYDCAYAGQEVYFADPMNNTSFRTNIRMQPFNRSLLEAQNFIDLNVFSHRKQVFETLGGFREDMRRLVDWELILKYTQHKRPMFIPALMNKYYFGLADNQITSTEPLQSNLTTLLAGS